MHEMSLCEGIRAIVEEQARVRQFTCVKTIRLELGRLACVEKAAMKFAFDVVMRGSPAEGAMLEFIDVKAQGTCFQCGKEVEIENRLAPCPLCGSGQVLAISGEEMRIKDMEVA